MTAASSADATERRARTPRERPAPVVKHVAGKGFRVSLTGVLRLGHIDVKHVAAVPLACGRATLLLRPTTPDYTGLLAERT
jgi:hypothetical protein